MRRVIGRDGIDAAVDDAREHLVAVGRASQRRVHLHVRVVAHRRRQRFVGQREVMRRHLARDARAVLLPFADRAQRCGRAHVTDVHRRARHFGQRDIALHHDRLGHPGYTAQAECGRVISLVRHAFTLQRRIFAVFEHRHVEHARILQRAPHQQRRLHRPSIIGNADAAGRAQLRDVGELIAVRALRDGADRVHACEAGLRRFLQDVLRDAGVVVDRRRVRHARNRGKAPRNRRRRAGRDGFLVFLPRLAEVDVHVEQPRRHDEASRHLDDRRAIDREDPFQRARSDRRR